MELTYFREQRWSPGEEGGGEGNEGERFHGDGSGELELN
jgi:hypothetical protein